MKLLISSFVGETTNKYKRKRGTRLEKMKTPNRVGEEFIRFLCSNYREGQKRLLIKPSKQENRFRGSLWLGHVY